MGIQDAISGIQDAILGIQDDILGIPDGSRELNFVNTETDFAMKGTTAVMTALILDAAGVLADETDTTYII